MSTSQDNEKLTNPIMDSQSDNILLTLAEVAKVFRVTTQAISLRIKRGNLPAEYNGNIPGVPLSALSPTAQARAREILAQTELT